MLNKALKMHRESGKPCRGEATQTLLIVVSTYANSPAVRMVLPLM